MPARRLGNPPPMPRRRAGVRASATLATATASDEPSGRPTPPRVFAPRKLAYNPDMASRDAARPEAPITPEFTSRDGADEGAGGSSGEALHILVVEDEPMVRQSTAYLLECLGHKVSEAANAEQALAVLEEQAVQVLLTDLNLPGVSGARLALEARRRQPALGIVFASGDREIPALAQDEALAGARFLAKPYDEHDLVKVLEAVLR